MCLKVKNKKPFIAKDDVRCYKVVEENGGKFFSPFYGFQYVLDKTMHDYNNKIGFIEGEVLFGLHTYERKEDALVFLDWLTKRSEKKYVILECVIPKRACYFEGEVYTGIENERGMYGKLPIGYASLELRVDKIVNGN